MLQYYDSKINGQIKVNRFLWETSVWVYGFEQSGPAVEKIWKNALKNILKPKKVLILGFGSGVIAKYLYKKFRGVEITGVEIDPVMVEIGKKYFSLPKAKVIIGNAIDFANTNKEKYDLVLVDMYVGNVAEKRKINFKKLMTKDGITIINHLEGLKNNFETIKFF